MQLEEAEKDVEKEMVAPFYRPLHNTPLQLLTRADQIGFLQQCADLPSEPQKESE